MGVIDVTNIHRLQRQNVSGHDIGATLAFPNELVSSSLWHHSQNIPSSMIRRNPNLSSHTVEWMIRFEMLQITRSGHTVLTFDLFHDHSRETLFRVDLVIQYHGNSSPPRLRFTWDIRLWAQDEDLPMENYNIGLNIDDIVVVMTLPIWTQIIREIIGGLLETTVRQSALTRLLMDSTLWDIEIGYISRLVSLGLPNHFSRRWVLDPIVVAPIVETMVSQQSATDERLLLRQLGQYFYNQLVANTTTSEQRDLERHSSSFQPIADQFTGIVRGAHRMKMTFAFPITEGRHVRGLFTTPTSLISTIQTITRSLAVTWRFDTSLERDPPRGILAYSQTLEAMWTNQNQQGFVGCRLPASLVCYPNSTFPSPTILPRRLAEDTFSFVSSKHGNCFLMMLTPLLFPEIQSKESPINTYIYFLKHFHSSYKECMSELRAMECKVWEKIKTKYSDVVAKYVDLVACTVARKDMVEIITVLNLGEKVKLWILRETLDNNGHNYLSIQPFDRSARTNIPSPQHLNIFIHGSHAYGMRTRLGVGPKAIFKPTMYRFCLCCYQETTTLGDDFIRNHRCRPNIAGQTFMYRQKLTSRKPEKTPNYLRHIIVNGEGKRIAQLIHKDKQKELDFASHLQTVFALDLETLNLNGNGEHVTYAAGIKAVYETKRTKDFRNYHMFYATEEFPDRALEGLVDHFIVISRALRRPITITSWNGSSFDYIPILRYLVKGIFTGKLPIDLVPNSIIRKGQRLFKFQLKVKGKGGSIITFHDLCLVVPASLSYASKHFIPNAEQEGWLKGDFEHDKMKVWADVPKYYNEWEPYLEQDVRVTCRLYEIIGKELFHSLGLLIGDYPSASALAHKAWRDIMGEVFAEETSAFVYAELPSLETDIKFRQGYFGGRTYPQVPYFVSHTVEKKANEKSMTPYHYIQTVPKTERALLYKELVVKKDCLKYVDVTSLYPAAMAEFYYPVGMIDYYDSTTEPEKCIHIQRRLMTEKNINHIPLCMVEYSMKEIPKDLNTAYLMRRDNRSGRLKHTLDPLIECTATTVDLWQAIQWGYSELTIHRVWEFSGKVKLFEKFVAKGMELKKKGETESNKALRMLGKLILNASYGKFAQNPVLTSWDVVYLSQLNLDKHYHFKPLKVDGEYCGYEVVTRNENADELVRYPVQIAAFIVAYSRVIMARAMKMMGNIRGKENMWKYTDTDSFIVSYQNYQSLYNLGQIPKEAELGKFTDEFEGGIIVEYAALAPKTYKCIVLYSDGKLTEYTRLKGIPHTGEQVELPLKRKHHYKQHIDDLGALDPLIALRRYLYCLTDKEGKRWIYLPKKGEPWDPKEPNIIPMDWFVGRLGYIIDQEYPDLEERIAPAYARHKQIEVIFGNFKKFISDNLNSTIQTDHPLFSVTLTHICRCLQNNKKPNWSKLYSDRRMEWNSVTREWISLPK